MNQVTTLGAAEGEPRCSRRQALNVPAATVTASGGNTLIHAEALDDVGAGGWPGELSVTVVVQEDDVYRGGSPKSIAAEGSVHGTPNSVTPRVKLVGAS